MWVIGGLLLVGLEIATPGGFFLLFFGIGGILVGILTVLNLLSSLDMQLFLFSVISVVAILLFRGRLREKVGRIPGKDDQSSVVGETATATEEISAGSVGKVELRGTTWSARNVGATPIHLGARVKVEKVDGLTLEVRKE